ncbi:L-aminopeptidase/D-esterase-like protein [Friedmanniella endophytica]|uniref:L-aminopeptidase/D-esterase-like protein n=1 Tax=Microlunatus kandeliicorticis TaxID=1759536 RepID=A0A7W3IUP4_9ACTN|nr:P1 family peptidase [Microlunatus kandeliicorticis]MBA8795602.1 L-aminopeptidase/D-esterase-like protein [Microlunatus kandeliicorticis]
MIAGFGIGHATADGDGWLTGTTVVAALAPAVGGVDVRGGGPGTRETDLLDPSTLVDRVDAVVLTGGSAYGLAAADGVVAGLEARGRGFPVGPGPGQVVPIVPAAVIFDLGRGGVFGHRPDAGFGRRALDAALEAGSEPATGSVGAGTGARCGGLKGGFGYAERVLDTGVSVGAAVVVNAAGSPLSPDGRLWADRERRLPDPTADERAALAAAVETAARGFNTTIGVVLTDATLTKAQARRVSLLGHDGMARAVAPVHTLSDGDTVFALGSGRVAPPADPYAALGAFNALLGAAADVFTEACLVALLAATGRAGMPAYRELVRVSG